MKAKLLIGIFIIILHLTLFAGVPRPSTHNPAVPYFMEQINFQTVLLGVYGKNISGIIPDKYSDLNWNPAFILNSSENGAYLDFNYQTSNYARLGYYQLSGSYTVSPQWYNNTIITPLQLNPLYNFALIQKISDKITIGIVNRTLFDYGAFRSVPYSRYYSGSPNSIATEYDKNAYTDLDLETVEVDENQQSVWGTQTEFTLGYNFSSKVDLGLKLGHYIFRQSGFLNDARYSKQLHSLIDENNSENFKTNGNQYEAGLGLVYHIDNKTELGIYASLMIGNSSEENISTDNSHIWSEKSIDTKYYSISKYKLASNYSFSSDGISPFFSLTFQKELSQKLMIRSFLSYRLINKDITGSNTAANTRLYDRTHDYYISSNAGSHFVKDVATGNTNSLLKGSGTEALGNFKWFTSLIYKTENKWSAFAAIMLQMQYKTTELSENSSYYNNYSNQRYYYDAGTYKTFQSYTKNYQYNYNYKRWAAIIPVGIKAHIYGGFSFLIGTDLQFEFVELEEAGDILYPERITKRTENGIVIENDVEKNRPETYATHNPLSFSKLSAIHLGAFYEHSSGLKLFVKTEGDIFNKSFWTFGIEYIF